MRFPFLAAIYRKEMLDLIRDRRTLISMVVVPVFVFPIIMSLMGFVIGAMEDKAERESKTQTIGLKVANPAVRETLSKAGLVVADKDNLRALIEQKAIVAGVEEVAAAGQAPEFRVYSDNSNPTSAAASEKVRAALAGLKEAIVRSSLRASGVPEAVLTPFSVAKVNVAPPKKMAATMWGSMLGYLMILLMFSGGMYPVIDMTAGEKERHTLESFLATPAGRNEIVVGKMLAAMTAILMTALLTLTSIVVSIRSNRIGGNSAEVRQMFSTIPLDAGNIGLILVTLLPLCVLAAAVMIAIAMFARGFKEGTSYLTPVMLFVLFPAMLGGMPNLELTPALALIPIFNASQLIRGIILGDFTRAAFLVTMAANLVYATIALAIAKNRFETESVLFRT
ncbi:MAG: ABC transporter permease [Acidobacteria bacterium]|nr:ABC transporter permease [Acidobacteriota bacterium]